MRIVTVYLKGPWARPGPHSGRDWDRGIVHGENRTTIALANNEHGDNIRSYPLTNVARIEETGHW
jgi:hypothetical protein